MWAWRSRYANGAGVDMDAAEAVKWYRTAADGGHAGAQHNLGIMSEQLPPRSHRMQHEGRKADVDGTERSGRAAGSRCLSPTVCGSVVKELSGWMHVSLAEQV